MKFACKTKDVQAERCAVQASASPPPSSPPLSSSSSSSASSSPITIARFSSPSSSSIFTNRSVGPHMNQYPIVPRTARPIQRHRMRSNRLSSSLFGARGSFHHERKLGYGSSALSLYRSCDSTGAVGFAALSTRRACEMSVGYDELRSDESNVSGS